MRHYKSGGDAREVRAVHHENGVGKPIRPEVSTSVSNREDWNGSEWNSRALMRKAVMRLLKSEEND